MCNHVVIDGAVSGGVRIGVLAVSGGVRIALGLAIMHDLISKHRSIQDSVNIESLATQNIAFRISDGISVNPNDVIHTAYKFLESESTTILCICQPKKKRFRLHSNQPRERPCCLVSQGFKYPLQ